MARSMAEVIALRAAWAGEDALATPWEPHPAGIDRLPTEWSVIDDAVIGGVVIDYVVVGPNGVFTINVDPDPRPATIGDDGIYRDGSRVTSTVKDALMAATRLRDDQGGRVFAYPILVSTLDAERHQLDRLRAAAGGRVAAHIWSHPGLPPPPSQPLHAPFAL